MKCRVAEGMVNRYINHTLALYELEEFLDHVESCSSCYDELETYFIINHAARYLDNDETASYNLKGLLEEDLKEKERSVRRKRHRNVFFSVLIFLLTVMLILFTMHYLNFIELPWLKGLF